VRIAVTGAAGYIGGWLVPALAAAGHEVHGQDIVPGAGARFDLHYEQARRAWLDQVRPDLVIHLAALYGRVWGERDLYSTVAANTGMTAELARDTAKAGARLLFVSSSEVYGASARTPGPVTEDMPLEPLNMYGASKKWGEEACRLYCPDGLMITRLNMPYGPARAWPEPGSVPHFSGRAGVLGYNVVHTMLWQAAHSLPVSVHRGTRRCLTWAGDTVRGIAMIAASGQAGVWNVNRDDDMIDVAEIARRAVALVPGCTSVITEEDPPDQVTLVKHLDSTRLRALGWAPEVSLDTGMRETLDYISRFGPDGRWHG
jgi:nucleoside-diphosphate-sugar epimerase